MEELINLTKQLDELAPEGFITTINIHKTVKGYKPMARLELSSFPYGGHNWRCIETTHDEIGGVSVVQRKYEVIENDEG